MVIIGIGLSCLAGQGWDPRVRGRCAGSPDRRPGWGRTQPLVGLPRMRSRGSGDVVVDAPSPYRSRQQTLNPSNLHFTNFIN